MTTRLPATVRTSALLLLLGCQMLAAQPAGLSSRASPGLAEPQRPALLTSNPVNQVLPVDSAFPLDVQLQDDASRVLLHWDIAPGYYLYRKSLKLSAGTGTEATLELPAGASIEDEFFGAVEVYYDTLQAAAGTDGLAASDGTLLLVVEYQGCAAERYCYPPQRKELLLTTP